MLYYTLLKLNPKIFNSSEKTINEIIESNFIKEKKDNKNDDENPLHIEIPAPKEIKKEIEEIEKNNGHESDNEIYLFLMNGGGEY